MTATAEEIRAAVEERGCSRPDSVDYRDCDKWIGGEARADHSDNDYQGNSWVLYQRGDEWGILRYGWGSCSGCDAAQGCGTWQDAADLINHLVRDVDWRTKDATIAWLTAPEREGEWDYNEGKAFREKALAVLRGEP